MQSSNHFGNQKIAEIKSADKFAKQQDFIGAYVLKKPVGNIRVVFRNLHFEKQWGVQRGEALRHWVSNRGVSVLLAGECNGDRVPVPVVSRGGRAALAGVSNRGMQTLWHTIFLLESLVCYTFSCRRPLKGVRRLMGAALCVGCRTGSSGTGKHEKSWLAC